MAASPAVAEWRARHPGWFSIPATFYPRTPDRPAEMRTPQMRRPEEAPSRRRPGPPPPRPGGGKSLDDPVRAFRAACQTMNDPGAVLRGSAAAGLDSARRTEAAGGELRDSDPARPREHPSYQLAQAFPLPGFAPPPPGGMASDPIDDAARELSNFVTRELRRVFANEATEEPQSPADILAPDDVRIGTPNRKDETVRNLPGGAPAAEKLFGKLSKGGTPTEWPGYEGTAVSLPGGGRIGYRPKSTSGPPAIDVNIPGLDIEKSTFRERSMKC